MKVFVNQIRLLPLVKVLNLSFCVGFSGVVLISPVLATEVEAQAENQPLASAALNSKDLAVEVEKKEAMIGIGGSPVSKTLSAQFGLANGVGLTIFHVVPGSPADKAGLVEFDVMLAFAGTPVGCQQDLKRLISQFHPKDEVEVKYLHQGKILQKKVVLGERPAIRFSQSGINPQWLFKGLGGEVPEAERQRIEAQMRQHMVQLRQQFKNQALMRVPLLGRAGMMNASSSIKISDDEGSVALVQSAGKGQIIVKDKEGKILYEGSYATEQDKAAVPEYVKKRLKELGFDAVGDAGLRITLPNSVEHHTAESPQNNHS